MSGPYAPGAPFAAGGVPISGVYYDRASSVVSGGEMGLRAGAGGVSIGRFGWARPDGTVFNARESAQDRLGLVVIQSGDWRRIFWDDASKTWKIREGMNLTMLSAAPGMLVRLAADGVWGQAVYTDPLDGSVIPGYADGLELTPWTLVRPASYGLSLISTWNTPT